MFEAILYLHLAGTMAFGLYAAAVVVGLVRGKAALGCYRLAAAVIGLHQVATGVALGMVDPNTSILAVCVRGTGLLAVLVLLEAVLTRRVHALELS